MIKFFRHIRKSYLMGNKTGKYFKYAIGEIILVVIGILIALQINNWNEDIKRDHKKFKVLKALKTEFKENLSQINFVEKHHNEAANAALSILDLRSTGIDHVSKDSLNILFRNIQYNYTFDPRNGGLRTAISSGDIHLIAHDELLTLLFEWQDVVADLREDELNSREFVKKNRSVIHDYIPRLPLSKLENSELPNSIHPPRYMDLLMSKRLEDFCGFRIAGIKEIITESQVVKDNNKTIIELINKELEND